MSAAIPVELWPHDPQWAHAAQQYMAQLSAALGTNLREIHHIGSTAIPGIRAKPILDLVPVLVTEAALDAVRPHVEALGFVWWGEYGLPGRRYCTLNHAETGRRLVQLHCYTTGSREITRHLAFRDYLRAHPEIAREYEALKEHCRAAHSQNSHDYSDCKSAWIRRVEALALEAS